MDQEALSIFLNNQSTKDKLAKRYAEVAGTIASAPLSMRLKNTNVEGEAVRGGAVKVFRMKTAVTQAYGTARTAGAGNKLQNNGVTVLIDTDREIVEEVEMKDLERYGLDNIIAKRTANHPVSMAVDLDQRYFVALQNAATVISPTGSTTKEKVLSLVRTLETLENENVSGVDRSLMVLSLAPEWYDTLKLEISALPNPNGGGQMIDMFHGVEIVSAPRQQFDAIVQVKGSVAQPLGVTPYSAAKIPLSNAMSLELYYSFGTYAVMPDCIFACALDEDISA